MTPGRRESAHSYTDQVRETLLKAIAEGTLEAGSVYPMQLLAEQLGVSRTPVREALLQLQQRSLIRIERNQGVRILGHTEADLREVFQLREWLEVPATEAAAGNVGEADAAALQEAFQRLVAAAEAGDVAGFAYLDRDFHSAVLALSGNARVVQIVSELREFLISRGYASSGLGGSLVEIARQHEPILTALLRQDAAAAGAAMAQHIRRIAEATISAASGVPSAFDVEAPV